MNNSNSGEIIFPGVYCAVKAENRAASQKSRFLRSARRKAQEYSEGLSSIFNAAGREKIPFEAVYPYVSAPKVRPSYGRFIRNDLRSATKLFSGFSVILSEVA